MRDNVHDFEDERYMTLAQVLALNITLTVSLAAALMLGGYSVFVSVGAAWLGGSVLTMGSLGAVYWVRMYGIGLWTEYRQNPVGKVTAPLVSRDITDPMEVWDTDRMLELELAHANGAVRQPDRQSVRSMDDIVQEWADDAAADSVTDRRTQPDRRQSFSPGRTDRRRAG